VMMTEMSWQVNEEVSRDMTSEDLGPNPQPALKPRHVASEILSVTKKQE